MRENNKWIIFLAFAAVYIIWGSTYLAILIGVKGFPPFLLCAFRFLLSGILLFAWRLAKGEKLISRSSIQINSLCGILMLFGGVGSVTWAEQYLPSSLAAIIVTALPFWFVVLDKKQWRFYFSNKFIVSGLVLGFTGVILLLGFEKNPQQVIEKTGGHVLPSLIILAGGLCWASGSLYSKYRVTGNTVEMNGAMQLVIAGIFSLLVSGFSGELKNFQFSQVGAQPWLALGYLVTFGSIITYLSYLFLLKVRPAAQVSTYVYINPIVALLLGTWLAGERITFMKILGLLIILCGVLMVNIPAYKPIKPEARKDLNVQKDFA